jgi:hypothetical protein
MMFARIAVLFFVIACPTIEATGGLGEPCGTSDCTYTQGYWKNHEESWPVTSLNIGGKAYTQSQLLTFFNTPPAGDATLILIHQLMAALLNKANGASTSSTINGYITQAQTLLTQYPPGSKPSSTTVQSSLTTVAGKLDEYNNGNSGPLHCDSNVVIRCNDNNPCTTDTCVSKKCVFTPNAECCNCYSDCRDSNPCTLDKCGPTNRCIHETIPGCII